MDGNKLRGDDDLRSRLERHGREDPPDPVDAETVLGHGQRHVGDPDVPRDQVVRQRRDETSDACQDAGNTRFKETRYWRLTPKLL